MLPKIRVRLGIPSRRPSKEHLNQSLSLREREPIFMLFKPEFDAALSGRRNSSKQPGQSPLPPGEGQGEGNSRRGIRRWRGSLQSHPATP